MVAGKSDLVYALGCFSKSGGFYLQTSLQANILVTLSQGGVAIDGVTKRFKREAGLRAGCKKGVALGFYGKSLGQPAQLDATNDVFAPTGATLFPTQRKIAVNDDTVNSG